MPTRIDLAQVQQLLLDDGAQPVEVLPAAECSDEHLPGAINIPLKQLNASAAEQLDQTRPVIVYWAASDRLLLGRPVGPEPPSRVPA